ncbi:SGNH/GDSL hydrolase family protein [Burkholderia cepacia]|nr:SGNH/GDSL hydrolase family protein [Burkholderia cepacia]
MFYSGTSHETLSAVCRKTLDAKGVRAELTQVVAANNARSFNYTVWTLDAASQSERVNKIVVFGDSLSDTQNMFNATQWRLPNRTSWYAGRFTNGPVWAEYLSSMLSLPMYNWAIGGSATDRYLVVPGLRQQVNSWQAYMQRAPNYRIENTLFAVFVGGNDFVNYGRTSEQAANAVHESIDKLASLGARRILILALPDVSRAPLFRTRGDSVHVANLVMDYNARLVDIVGTLRSRYGSTLRIEVFDTYSLFKDLFNRPAAYGFENATRACLDIGKPSALSYLTVQIPSADCRDPSRFVFWDALHPTTRTHALLAEQLASFVRRRFAN